MGGREASSTGYYNEIGSVFECDEKGYVIDGGDYYGKPCKRIYEWNSENRELELLTKIPKEGRLVLRSALGHNGNIYLVGGGLWDCEGYTVHRTHRVDCFN